MSREPLRCQHCGAAALPIDPGWTLSEVAKMLRITKRYVLMLAQAHATELDEPHYRTLTPLKVYRIWSSKDVQALNHHLLRKRVKSAATGRIQYVKPSREMAPVTALSS